MKKHIKIHNSIAEVEDLKEQVKSLKIQVEQLEEKLKNSQKNKLAIESQFADETKKKRKSLTSEEMENKEAKKSKRFSSQIRQKNAFKQKAKMECRSPKRPKTNEAEPSNPKLFCDICQHQFNKRNNFNRHKVRKHGTQEKIFGCSECNTKFTTKE